MALSRGLKGIKEYEKRQEEKAAAASADRLPWFSFPDGQRIKFRPLQEFDEASPYYSDKNGLVGLAVLHSNPDDFRKSAECTAYEGNCLGCELYRSLFPNGKGWKAYTKLYLNGLVEEKDSEGTVTLRHVLVGASKQLQAALQEYAEEEDGVTNRWWRVTRNDKTYTVAASSPDDSVNPEDYELVDLERAYKHIPYEEQEAFYGLLAERPAESPADAPADLPPAAEPSDDEW